MTLSALVPIANGSEEIEAITIINLLRRANIHVTVASVEDTNMIEGSRGVKIVADENIKESRNKVFDLIVLPGGLPGAEHLRDSPDLIAMLHEQNQSKRLYAAICASPSVVLEPHNLLEGKKACCYPCFKLEKAHQPDDPKATIVISKNLATAQGPAMAMEFSLKLIEWLKGGSEANKIAQGLLFTPSVAPSCS